MQSNSFSNAEVFYKSRLFSTADNLRRINELAIHNYVWKYFCILMDMGDTNVFTVPSDFDPECYLLFNPDVVNDERNPYEHYTEYGFKEERQYKILDEHILLDSISNDSNDSNDSNELEKKSKKIIFHIGGAKTGSSALQNFLEINFELIEKFGFAYENRLNITSKNEITGGNGYFLFNSLKDNVSDERLDYILMSFFGRFQNGICSSEFLSQLNSEEWERICQSCRRLNIDYDVILYVRDVVPSFYSAYNQCVKRLGECKSIYEFSLIADWVYLNTLTTVQDSLDTTKIKVFSYSSVEGNIVKHFLHTIGVNCIEIDCENTIVNRSLTPVELELMIGMNKCLGTNFSMVFSDHLIYSRPDIKTYAEYDSSVISLLEQRFKQDIEWVNETFFEGEHVISLLHNSNKNSLKNIELQQSNEKILVMKILCECISKMSSFDNVNARVYGFSTTIPSLINKPDYINLDSIPSDFNPIDYLLLNPDAVFSGQNAYTHYLSSGDVSKEAIYHFNCENYMVCQ
jgi:hypothetical protein